jgi:succinoglycan biosynthesis transport protein ExoP
MSLPAAKPMQFVRIPPQVASVETEEQWITFSDLLRILRINWPKILLAAVVAAMIAAVVVMFMTPTYVGTALVMVDEQQNRVFKDDASVLSDLPSDPSSVESQVTVIQSHSLVAEVVDRLKLWDDPDFNGAGKPSSPLVRHFRQALGLLTGNKAAHPDVRPLTLRRDLAIKSVSAGLGAQIVGRSTVIEVDFRSSSPDQAARIANAVADTYVDSIANAKSSASEKASKWLADQVTQLSRQAAAADAAVQVYKAQNGLIDTSSGTALTDQQLGDLTTQLIAAQGTEAEARAKLSRVKELVASGNSADVTEVVDSPLIGQLREQESTLLQQKADFSSRYGDRNPKMISLQTQLQVLSQKIKDEANRIVGTVANSVAVASAHVQALRSEMGHVTASANTQNQARVKLGELLANSNSAHAVYQTYLDRLKQTQQQASLKIADVHVASSASVPDAPVSPKGKLIIGGAALAGLVLGFLYALLADRLCAGFCSAQELERTLGLPVLATMPELGAGRGIRELALESIARPYSEFSEGIRALELALSRQRSDETGGKVAIVVSALPSEGKTTTAVNIARRFAADGKRVIIVDGDLRRPNVAIAMGIERPKYDLADYLARRCLLDDAITADPQSSLVALSLSRGSRLQIGTGMPELVTLVQRLREIADFVIIDAPPVLAVQDAKLFAELSDGALLAVRWGKTPKEAVSRAVKSLRDFGVPMIGAVLTRAHAKYHRFYSYGYAGLPALGNYYEQ